jgi:hypothetical protein
MQTVQETTPLKLTLQNLNASTAEHTITLAVCMQQANNTHAHYIRRLIQSCAAHTIACTIIPVHTTQIQQIITLLERQPLTAILCLDNSFAHAILIARAKIHSSAPLIFSDLTVPLSIPHPLPPKCMTLSTPLTHFVPEMCHIITHMPSIRFIMLMYDEHDELLCSLVPDMHAWLIARNYTVHTTVRKPTITRHDVMDYAQYNLIIFLCRNAPEEYLQRLTLVRKEQNTLLYAADSTALNQGAVCTFGPNINHMIQETVNALLKYKLTNTLENSVVIPYLSTINTYELASYTPYAAELASLLTLARNTTIINPTTADKVTAYLQLERIPLE